MNKFRVREDFFSEALQSHYCRGLLYTIRPGDSLLAESARIWLSEGKIEMVEGASRLVGTAQVN